MAMWVWVKILNHQESVQAGLSPCFHFSRATHFGVTLLFDNRSHVGNRVKMGETRQGTRNGKQVLFRLVVDILLKLEKVELQHLIVDGCGSTFFRARVTQVLVFLSIRLGPFWVTGYTVLSHSQMLWAPKPSSSAEPSPPDIAERCEARIHGLGVILFEKTPQHGLSFFKLNQR